MIRDAWAVSPADLARRRTIEGGIDEISVVSQSHTSSGQYTIAEVRGFSRIEALTSALLIARAPEMARLLRRLADQCESDFHARGRWEALPNDLVHALCALANAVDFPETIPGEAKP